MPDDRPNLRALALPACGVVLAMLALGCTTKVRPYECPALVESGASAEQIWTCQRDIMVRAAKGKKFTIQEFEGAAVFFESLTGIPADSRATPVGEVPGKGVRKDLRRWDAWLEEHRIFRDPATGQVKAAEVDEGR
jgi:hypothetical protein